MEHIEIRRNWFVCKNIVTSSTNLVSIYFVDLEDILMGEWVHGSVEAGCTLGVAEGMVVLVESREKLNVQQG